jgi:hypothetical protein
MPLLPQAQRSVAAIPAFGAIVALTACGSGGGDGSPPETAPGTLATTTGVEAHLTVVSGRVPIPRITAAIGSSAAGPAAVTPCTQSGTRDDVRATRDVHSPYLDESMLVTRVTYDRCVDFVGPPDDPEGATSELHGVEEFAQADIPEGAVIYLAIGDPQTSQMREFRYRSSFTGQLHEQESLVAGRTDALTDAALDVDVLTWWSEMLDIRFDGETSASGSYRFGTDSAPFHINSRGGRTEFLLEGEYEFNAGPCDPGPANVATDRWLVYDTGTERFVDGMLTFTSTLGTATAVFNADGTVTLMDVRGRTITMDWPARLAPWDGNSCFQP